MMDTVTSTSPTWSTHDRPKNPEAQTNIFNHGKDNSTAGDTSGGE